MTSDDAEEPSRTEPTTERSSDQAPGEEAVQVNDQYKGGGPPPEHEPALDDDQHRTGG